MMQFCDLKAQYHLYKAEIDSAIAQVLESSAFILGPEVQELEKELAAYTSAPHVITCANGSDALQLALMALDIKTGDEVIVPDFTFYASAEMISLVGATPVFCDIDLPSFQISAEQVRTKITPRTKAIMAVSLFGQIPDMEALNLLAQEYGLYLIEDGAQSFGASQHGIKSCNYATLSTTSFFPAKPLGCYGDGGAVFTQDTQLAEKIRILANHGSKIRYEHSHIGLNSRLDSIQAAILRIKLRYLDQEIVHRQKMAELYTLRLAGVVETPQISSKNQSAWAQYTIRTPKRNELQKFLNTQGIPTAIHYPIPLHQQAVYRFLDNSDQDFPNSILAAQSVLSLPMSGVIKSEEVELVCEKILEFFG